MARRARGEGSIYQRQDGYWVASLRWGNRRTTVYATTKQEAVSKLQELQRAAHTLGRLPDPARLTVRDYLTLWLEQAAQRLKVKTLANYQGLAEHLITPHLGAIKLTRLNGLTLANYFARLTKENISPFRQRQAFALLHKALGDAVRWGLIPHNPATTIDRPKPKGQRRTIWTPQQVTIFLRAVEVGKGGQYADLFAFLLASGCRLGEALGLTWRDIDWQAGTVRIERQITEVAGKPIEGRPKSEAGIRTVALPSWGLATLQRQRARVREWQLKSDNPFAPGWQHCFVTGIGSMPEATNLRRAFRRLCEVLGLPPLRLHDLRHTNLSLLAASGVPVKDLQQRAGHSSATLTLSVYLHAAEDGDRKAAQMLEFLAGR